jgi:hypothetical protein
MNMNRKQIEEEMKRVTEEGRQLQEKLLIVEALKECKEKGHDAIQAELDMDFYGATRADFVCRRCAAQLFLRSFIKSSDNNNDGVWYWGSGPFNGKTVADVYEEEEPEEPAPELEPNFDAERKQNMTFPPPSQEETQTGAYRVDTSSMFKSRDHNVEY